jgi:hypothetical protein
MNRFKSLRCNWDEILFPIRNYPSGISDPINTTDFLLENHKNK